MSKAAVLWTGGKDSCLAYLRAKEGGENVVSLVTFFEEGREFRAHPREQIRDQANHLGIPVHFLPVSEPYRAGYGEQIERLRSERGISKLITGDIDLVDGFPNWIKECCDTIGLEVGFPLWQEDRRTLLEDLFARDLPIEITWINHPAISKDWLGKRLTREFIDHLRELPALPPIDLCGENGEYHTMVRFPPRSSDLQVVDEGPELR